MASDPPASGLGRFISELRRRHVVRVAVAYAAVGFVLLQAAEIVLPAFLPGFEADAALRVLVMGFLLLFPVVVVLAWVYEITPQGVRSMESLDAESGQPPTGRVLPRVALLLFTVVAAGSAGLWWYRTDAAVQESFESRERTRSTPFVGASTTDASGPIRSLAVLPLEDFSSGDDDGGAYFAAGMHEALISQLSQLGTVRVISRTSTEGYRREGRSLPQVGEDLGVDAVVEGSVLRADGRVRITVQLVHAASDTHLLARDYERELSDIIALQREVATAIAGEIEARIQEESEPSTSAAVAAVTADGDTTSGPASDRPVGDEVASGTPPPPVAPVATSAAVQDAVLRGRFALNQPSDSGARVAERFFEEALADDSAFTPALTGLAGAHLIRGLEIPGPGAWGELMSAREIAERAVVLEPTSMEAQEVLAAAEEALAELGVRLAEGVAVGAEGEARIVRASGDTMWVLLAGDTTRLSRPGAPTASATEMGRLIQVAMAREHEGQRSVADEMRSIFRLQVGGRWDAAAERARRAVERFPDEPELWDAAECSSVSAGDTDAALEIRREREALDPGLPGPGSDDLAARLEARGVGGYWAWKLDELDARAEAGRPASPVDRAAAYSALGRVDEAMALLEEARGARDPRLVSLRTDPVWDPLRPDPRFKALLRTLGPRVRPPTRRTPR